jgi:hypothetical protein
MHALPGLNYKPELMHSTLQTMQASVSIDPNRRVIYLQEREREVCSLDLAKLDTSVVTTPQMTIYSMLRGIFFNACLTPRSPRISTALLTLLQRGMQIHTFSATKHGIELIGFEELVRLLDEKSVR